MPELSTSSPQNPALWMLYADFCTFAKFSGTPLVGHPTHPVVLKITALKLTKQHPLRAVVKQGKTGNEDHRQQGLGSKEDGE